MKKLLTVILIILCLFSVTAQSSKEKKVTPWVNSNIYDNWPEVKLEDNYELYVNRPAYMQALKNNITEDDHYSRSETYQEEIILELLNDETKTSDELELLRGYFKLFNDTEKRTNEGIEPLMYYINLVREADTVQQLSEVIQTGLLFGDPIAHFKVDKADDDITKYGLRVSLFLPVGERMENNTEEDMNAALANIKDLLTFTGYADDYAAEITDQLLQLEQYCYYEDDETVNMTLDQIKELCTPLYDLIVGLGYVSYENLPVCYMVEDYNAFGLLNQLYIDDNVEVFKGLFSIEMAAYASYFLTPYDDSVHPWDFMMKYLKGPLDQAYVEFAFPEETREKVKELTQDYIQAMRKRILSEDWLSEATKAKAVEKIDNMVAVVVYPDEWIDFSMLLELVQDHDQNLLDAVLCRDDFYRDYYSSFLGQDVERGDWILSDTGTTEANAYYFPGENSINILAGIFYEGLFSDEDYESLLGTIGVTIGHEITHGFDTGGSEYDSFGNRANWWTDEDRAKFEAKAQVIIDQLNKITLLSDGYHQDGKKIIDEMVADLGGIALTLDLAREIEGFDYDKFFKAYAYTWYSIKPDEDTAREQYETDSHPADYVRANYVVQQFDEFYRTYPQVKPKSGMYVEPNNRVSVW